MYLYLSRMKKKSLIVASITSLGYFIIAFFVYYRGEKDFLIEVLIQTLLFFISGGLFYYFLNKKFLS